MVTDLFSLQLTKILKKFLPLFKILNLHRFKKLKIYFYYYMTY